MKNIFVGNIDFDTKEEDLRELFASYGPVSQVTIVRDRYSGQPRGFAFVEMASVADGEKAIAELDGTQLGGRKLNVNEARPRPERFGSGRESGAPQKRRTLVKLAGEKAAIGEAIRRRRPVRAFPCTGEATGDYPSAFNTT